MHYKFIYVRIIEIYYELIYDVNEAARQTMTCVEKHVYSTYWGSRYYVPVSYSYISINLF